jgi:hypothetical protein
MVLGYLTHQWGTTKHKLWIMFYVLKYCFKVKFSWNLIKRGLKHDLSKYSWFESKGFAQVIFKLKKLTYGSEEYIKCLRIIKPSIDHHYKINRHHPEYHKNGFFDMTELDKIEMVIDWLSACKRHKDGNIYKSIEINKERFGYDEDTRRKFIFLIDEIN